MAMTIECKGKKLEVDEDGFLKNINCWDINVAERLAETEGIGEMTGEHWKVITAIRLYYERNGVSPLCRDIVKTAGVSKKELYRLFPTGHIRGAYKVAGLPKPAGCN